MSTSSVSPMPSHGFVVGEIVRVEYVRGGGYYAPVNEAGEGWIKLGNVTFKQRPGGRWRTEFGAPVQIRREIGR